MALDWINDIERAKTRSQKIDVVEKALIASRLGSASAQCFLYNCYLSHNPNYVYYTKQVPLSANLAYKPNSFVRFWALCESLHTRSISGKNIHTSIQNMSMEFDSPVWNSVCRDVLLKKFGKGLTINMLNTVLKNTEWEIPRKHGLKQD